jgi:hypothetical protein
MPNVKVIAKSKYSKLIYLSVDISLDFDTGLPAGLNFAINKALSTLFYVIRFP